MPQAIGSIDPSMPDARTLPSKQLAEIVLKQDGTPENFFRARFASEVNGTWQSAAEELSQTLMENL